MSLILPLVVAFNIHFIQALTIDNQLTVIKNDCYDRLAIGHRLNPQDVYKTFNNLTTVLDCQQACTKDNDFCKAFSFGIGVKGNATCELGLAKIKETADLKPIGTVIENDFDLYIKKLGCTLRIEKKPHVKPPGLYQDTISPASPNSYGDNQKPPKLPKPAKPPSYNEVPHGYPENQVTSYQTTVPSYEPSQNVQHDPPNPYEDHNSNRPQYLPEKPQSVYQTTSKYPEDLPERPQNEYHKYYNEYERPSSVPDKPESSYINPDNQHRPPHNIPSKPQGDYSGSENGYERPQYLPKPPLKPQDDVQHVHTLVSISTGPYPLTLHPVHNILMGNNPANYGDPNYRPSYGEVTNKPASSFPNGGYSLLPRPTYENNQEEFQAKPQSEYNKYYEYERPSTIPDKPQSSYTENEYRPPQNIPSKPQNGYNELPPHKPPVRPSNDGYGQQSKPQKPISKPPQSNYHSQPQSYGPFPRPPESDYGPWMRPHEETYGRPEYSTDYDWQRPVYRRPYEYERYSYKYYDDLWSSETDELQSRPYYGPYPERYASYIPRPDEYYHRPTRDEVYNVKPNRYDVPKRPSIVSSYYQKYPSKLISYDHHADKLQSSNSDYKNNNSSGESNNNNQNNPNNPNIISDYDKKNVTSSKPEYDEENKRNNKPHGVNNSKPIITETLGPHGEHIISIITEITKGKSSKLLKIFIIYYLNEFTLRFL